MYGFLASLPAAAVLPGLALLCVVGAFLGLPLVAWTVAVFVLLVGFGAAPWLFLAAALPALVLNRRSLRRVVVTRPLMSLVRAAKLLPVISDTEREALEAGTVWVDGDLFSGRPDFAKLLREPYPEPNAREQAFLEGPVEEVCRMTDDWEVHQRRDLPPEVWEYLRREGFFGLIIPEKYGGKGFSPSGNSAIVAKLCSRSGPLGVTVMVPNSLGPAELLIHYGTREQKDHYLPRLASGEDIPCFALTEPAAGSDAGAIQASGEVFRGSGGELLLRLDWDKRYITLAAVSTVLGLAFKLHDPNHLLGRGEDLGITCALIPSDAPGIELGRRHDPLGSPFFNCPTTGRNVVVPIDCIIGGADGAGRGWKMLMECLAAGRGISLPASATATVALAARVGGAYALVRKQFGLPIGRFEGIEAPLARIGGFAYLLEAARRFTCGGLDGGAKPAVVTAIAKYNFTELARVAINDCMDIVGGAGISRGPRNLLAHIYWATPISITVEGANILTRTLIIFGQGAIRSHPFAYKEIECMERDDVAGFDEAFFGHVGHVARNGARSLLLSLTRGLLARSPVRGPAARYYRKLAWSSASFAFLADVAMVLLGGDLKRRGSVTGRFADIFSWMYLGQAVLRRFEAEGRRAEDLPLMRWAMDHSLARIQEGFDGLLQNLDLPLIGALFDGPIALWSRANRIGGPPSDKRSARVAAILQTPGEQRDRLTAGIYLPAERDQALGRLEHAFGLCHEAETVARKMKRAMRGKKLARGRPEELLETAVRRRVITGSDLDLVRTAEAARRDAIQVDSFTLEEYLRSAVEPAQEPEPDVSLTT